MAFSNLPLQRRIHAVNIDCMRHPKFALLSGVIPMGKSEVRDGVETAYTDGKDKVYGSEFIAPLNRKQLRYVVLHENLHVALKHCVMPLYREYDKKYTPRICNIAMDFVINGMIEDLDPRFDFVERPIEGLCIDDKYKNMSFPQVLRELAKNPPPDDKQPLDEHKPYQGDGTPTDGKSAADQLSKDVDDANRQGKIVADKLAGKGGGGNDILQTAADRNTNWRGAFRDFLNTVCEGDDQSRFCPPNKRLLASGYIMPSHFSETVGELVVACDTSGSMSEYYDVLFGELAQLCKTTRPDSVRVIWWGSSVVGEQSFKPHEYDNITKLIKPKDGGGTNPHKVPLYMAEHQIKPKAIVWLTDGYFDATPSTSAPSLWGVVDNDSFVPAHGKLVHINL